MTSMANPVIDQMLARVTTSSGWASRKFELCRPLKVANVPPPVVEAYQVIPAVTAGIIQATTTTPPTMMRIHERARMSSDARPYPTTMTPTIDPPMKKAVVHNELQNSLSDFSRARFWVPVKPHLTAVGPTRVRLVRPR